jgi:hypothetical protein
MLRSPSRMPLKDRTSAQAAYQPRAPLPARLRCAGMHTGNRVPPSPCDIRVPIFKVASACSAASVHALGQVLSQERGALAPACACPPEPTAIQLEFRRALLLQGHLAQFSHPPWNMSLQKCGELRRRRRVLKKALATSIMMGWRQGGPLCSPTRVMSRLFESRCRRVGCTQAVGGSG